MQQLIQGQKCKMKDLMLSSIFQVQSDLMVNGFDLDISCFCVDKEEKLLDERYFVFYNQLSSPEEAIVKKENQDLFTIDFNKIPNWVEHLIFTAAIDGDAVMGQMGQGRITILENKIEKASFALSGSMFQKEKAIILMEFYKKNDGWRVSAVGRGFNGGLSVLLAHYGGVEEVPQEIHTESFPQQKEPDQIQWKKKEEAMKVVLEKAPRLTDLTKKAIVSLEKKKLAGIQAKVVLVLDVSGSMYRQYSEGRVQRILDKVLPLALLFDNDGELESWTFARRYRKLEMVTIDNINDYINTANGGWKKWNVGGSNNEPAVMEAICLEHKKETTPIYLIFISDGGVSRNKQIKDIIKKAAYAPLFWQFIGISGSNYGILENLDEMKGRYIDNANFFALDDIDEISDSELYDRMMQEFPLWLKEAKKKKILPS